MLEARADDAALAAEISALAQERTTIEAEQTELDRGAAALLSQLDDLAGTTPAEDRADCTRWCAKPRRSASKPPAVIARQSGS